MSSIVEVALDIVARVAQKVDKGTLFDEVVFGVDADVGELLLSVNQVLSLSLLDSIRPLDHVLSPLVLCVVNVEVGELWTWHESVMSDLREAHIQSDQIFVMMHQGVPPVILSVASLK